MRNATIREIVTEWKEPRRTQMLRALVDGGVAVSVVYRPDPMAPAHRREFVDVTYNRRTIRFHAGRPISVSVGLASHIVDQFRPFSSRVPEIAWFEGEWAELGDEIDLDAVGPLPSATIESHESLTSHLQPLGDRPPAGGRAPHSDPHARPSGALPRVAAPREDDVSPGDGHSEDDAPSRAARRADDSRPARATQHDTRPLHALNKSELSDLHAKEIGPVPAGAGRSAILSAVKTARDAAAKG